jgi:hypothetical protein
MQARPTGYLKYLVLGLCVCVNGNCVKPLQQVLMHVPVISLSEGIPVDAYRILHLRVQ